MDATVVLARRGSTRELLVEFITGVKRTVREPGELIWQIKVPRLDGPQDFLKVGTRNAMVISIVLRARHGSRQRTVRVRRRFRVSRGTATVVPAKLATPSTNSVSDAPFTAKG